MKGDEQGCRRYSECRGCGTVQKVQKVQGVQKVREMERETGIEPATSSLGSWHSTAELLPLCWQVCYFEEIKYLKRMTTPS